MTVTPVSLETESWKCSAALTGHADLEVGGRGRSLFLLGCLSEPGLEGEDDGNPAAVSG